jgi:hypothetical protein
MNEDRVARVLRRVDPRAGIGCGDSSGPGGGDARVIEYADGRVVSIVLQPKGSVWTFKFPRIARVETSRAGRVPYALEVAQVVDGRDVLFP